MTVFKLAWLELRRFRGPLWAIVPAVLVLVPLLYGAMYLWANWDPYDRLDRVPVAVVNDDQLAHTNGKRIDAGDQLVEQLKASDVFDWHFVDAETARRGLEHGQYYFTITIPEDFSSKLATGTDTKPQQANIELQLNDANNYLMGVMTKVVQPELQDQINSATHAAYVRSIYGELSDMRDRLKTASDGGHRLADATQLAKEGSATLKSGTEDLSDGVDRVSRGTNEISNGLDSLDKLSNELLRVVSDTLPTATAGLTNAANLAAQGTGTIHDGTQRVKNDAAQGVSGLDQLADKHPELKDDPLFDKARHDARRLKTAATDVNKRAADADTQAHRAQARAKKVENNTSELRSKVLRAQDSLSQISSGSTAIAGGTSSISAGMDALSDEADTFHKAATQAHSGAVDISDTIDAERDKIPKTSPDEVAHAAEVLGTPTRVESSNMNSGGVYGRGLAPFFFGIALWVFGLVGYLFLRPIPTRVLASRLRSATVAVVGWLPGAALGIISALVLYTVVNSGLGLDPVHAGLTVLLMAVGVAAFVSIVHFLRATFGAVGDLFVLALLILQITASGGLYPVPTTPEFFQFLNPLMPMTYLIDGLRVTIYGGLMSDLWFDIAVLTGLAVVFLGLTALVMRRYRVWSMSRLHPDVEI